jgi:hypothetical protein
MYLHHRHKPDPWRNGSASDSRSEGCVFDSRRVQTPRSLIRIFFIGEYYVYFELSVVTFGISGSDLLLRLVSIITLRGLWDGFSFCKKKL